MFNILFKKGFLNFVTWRISNFIDYTLLLYQEDPIYRVIPFFFFFVWFCFPSYIYDTLPFYLTCSKFKFEFKWVWKYIFKLREIRFNFICTRYSDRIYEINRFREKARKKKPKTIYSLNLHIRSINEKSVIVFFIYSKKFSTRLTKNY